MAFVVLTILDKNVLYCLIIALFGVVLVVSVRMVALAPDVWYSKSRCTIVVYLWLALYPPL